MIFIVMLYPKIELHSFSRSAEPIKKCKKNDFQTDLWLKRAPLLEKVSKTITRGSRTIIRGSKNIIRGSKNLIRGSKNIILNISK